MLVDQIFQLLLRMTKNLKNINNLIDLADVEWKLHWAGILMEKEEGIRFKISAPPRFHTLDISLMFDILTNKLCGPKLMQSCPGT